MFLAWFRVGVSVGALPCDYQPAGPTRSRAHYSLRDGSRTLLDYVDRFVQAGVLNISFGTELRRCVWINIIEELIYTAL